MWLGEIEKCELVEGGLNLAKHHVLHLRNLTSQFTLNGISHADNIDQKSTQVDSRKWKVEIITTSLSQPDDMAYVVGVLFAFLAPRDGVSPRQTARYKFQSV